LGFCSSFFFLNFLEFIFEAPFPKKQQLDQDENDGDDMVEIDPQKPIEPTSIL